MYTNPLSRCLSPTEPAPADWVASDELCGNAGTRSGHSSSAARDASRRLLRGSFMRGSRASKGFTLIEVLVALSILTLIFGAALEVFSRGLGAMSASEAHALASAFARARLDEMSAAGLSPGVTSGRERGGDHGLEMQWEAQVTAYEEDDLGPSKSRNIDLLRVVVRVTWSDGVRERHIRLETLGLAVAGAP